MHGRIVERTFVDNAGSTDPGVQRLYLEVGSEFSFIAGQYLLIQASKELTIPLSIASAPARLPHLELHYRSSPELPEAAAFDVLIKNTLVNKERVEFSGPFGTVNPGPNNRPLLVIAGGTGIAQAFACAESRRHTESPTTVLWCADRLEEFYGQTEFAAYGTDLVTIADDQRTPANEGLVWLHSNAERFTDSTIIIAGAPPFVYAVTDTLLANDFSMTQLQSDVYSYAPRDD